jgi:hypothetical protein
MGIEGPDRRRGHLCESFVQVVEPSGAMTSVPDVCDGVPAVVRQAVTQRREQWRPAQKQATVSVTGQHGLIAQLDVGPWLGIRVVPVGTLPVDWRLVEGDNIHADRAQPVRPVSGSGADLH